MTFSITLNYNEEGYYVGHFPETLKEAKEFVEKYKK